MTEDSERYNFFKGNQNEDDIESQELAEKRKEKSSESGNDNWYYEVKIVDPKGLHLRNSMNLTNWKETYAHHIDSDTLWIENKSGSKVATFDSIISIGLLNVQCGGVIYIVSTIELDLEDHLIVKEL